MTPEVDVAVAAPFRFPGPATDDAVDEVRAACACGLTTAAIDLSNEATPVRYDPVLEYLVTEYGLCLRSVNDDLRARLLVLRGLGSHGWGSLARLQAERKIVVAADPVADAVVTTWRRFDTTAWPGDVVIAPEGPRARQQIAHRVPHLPRESEDWLPALDPAEWSIPSSGEPPQLRIGVMLPPDLPAEAAATVTRVLPRERPVRLLVEGATDVLRVQERLPTGVSVASADDLGVRAFLRDVDVVVAPSSMWPPLRYGVGSLLAGRPLLVIHGHPAGSLPPTEEVAPDHFRARLCELTRDADGFAERVETGRQWAQRHASPAVAGKRLGAPESDERRRTPMTAIRGSVPRRRVLFISSNGAGTGHLTRLAAMARQSSSAVDPFFVSLSQGVGLLEHNGWLFEYVPSRGVTGMDERAWNRLLQRRLTRVLHEHQPAVVVFDGTWPYAGLVGALLRYDSAAVVWSRRGMWRTDIAEGSIAKSSMFDLVIEPGELAAHFDAGATAALTDARRVEPVIYSSPEEALDRDAARAELAIPDGPAVLVTLGAGNINDVTSPLRRVVKELTERGVHVCMTSPDIAYNLSVSDYGTVIPVRTRPLAPLLFAFDAAVSAAGYNSYHELIAHRLPTLFLPNRETAVDDQLARARYAACSGLGLCCSEPDGPELRPALHQLMDPDSQTKMRRRLAELESWRGAGMAMRLIEELVGSLPWPVGTAAAVR